MINAMHDYLDGDLSVEEQQQLMAHLNQCQDCLEHFNELKKVIALVQSTSHISAPDNFTQNVLDKLPKEKKRIGAKRWLQQYPLLSAAAMFIVLMGGSLFTTWNGTDEFSYTKQPNLVASGDTVVVPPGETVQGDVIVRNGNIKIEGKVDGSVTVINGDKYLASAGSVTGEIEEIDQAFEWLWYQMKKLGKQFVP
ncbi:anti-sigma factor family protein [Mangrovibacillus cuniculi]|uniref:Anti-sigma-W factor RsiW n=1 Tax=Mangrovibacillus cuniculi TaxID=2593652 RepID=A0A7S8CEF9_9BACI|nr:anti-sigma factor [Mangrovibacillus cuniculi]QPC48480.1 anti-sigma factor [Mangrovibacillus cuniculi]